MTETGEEQPGERIDDPVVVTRRAQCRSCYHEPADRLDAPTPACWSVAREWKVVERARARDDWGLPPCRICRGAVGRGRAGATALHHRLLDADPDAVGGEARGQ